MKPKIIFLHWREPQAPTFLAKLQDKHDVIPLNGGDGGVFRAHEKILHLINDNDWVFLVDGDTEIFGDVNLYETFDKTNRLHAGPRISLFYSKNEVNGTCDGYSGIKLINKKFIEQSLKLVTNQKATDLFTITKQHVIVPTPISYVRFDQTPLMTFTTVVRRIIWITNRINELEDKVTLKWYKTLLENWCTKTPNTLFSKEYIAGIEFGLKQASFVPKQKSSYDITNFKQIEIDFNTITAWMQQQQNAGSHYL